MPGHYRDIVNLDEVSLTKYQQRVFNTAQRLLTERADSATGETILPDAYVIQKELLTMITDPDAKSEGNFRDDASRLVNTVLDIEEVEIPIPPPAPTPPPQPPVTATPFRQPLPESPVGGTIGPISLSNNDAFISDAK